MLSTILWNVSPEFFTLGPISVRWYGLLFAGAFLIGYQIMLRIFGIERRTQAELDSLTIHSIIGTVVGARLGHCLFYDPSYYLANPEEILAIWHGGLASHGATIGLLIVFVFYVLKWFPKLTIDNYLWVLDRFVVPASFGAVLVRLGNLFNSEIIGKPAVDIPWAFIFKRVDDIPRHPTQIYEALLYLMTFGILSNLYFRLREKTPSGLLVGVFFICIFGSRFVIEYFKENQVSFESTMMLNMGQNLSIPFVILGFALVGRALQTQKKVTNS